MKNRYIQTKSESYVAMIGKTGSSTISRQVLLEQYPEKIPVMVGADPSNIPGWQNLTVNTEYPDTDVLVLVRNPVDRFISACAQLKRMDIDQVLDDIEIGGDLLTEYHFRSVMRYTEHNQKTKLYKFPDHLPEVAKAIQLKDPIPITNDNKSQNPPKAILTAEQIDRVKLIYAEDIKLFESIKQAGQIYKG